ncbi:VWA domain-containing protein [Streptosporangium sp. NPDC000095]|uniref:vWA domain-containing protein n=1 Tax=Streptosporangium sp. NPDC000095 TaxID=3366184 RepID=UPI0036AF5ED4
MSHSPEPTYNYALPRAFPFYITCDVSHSMHAPREDGRQTPFDILSNCVGELLFQLEAGDPGVSEAAHVSIVAFHDRADVVLPLTRPCDASNIPALPKGGQTNYEQVFLTLRQLIQADCSRLAGQYQLKAPVVFFITDGEPFVGKGRQPAEVWLPARARLTDPAFPHRPHITAMGFGQVTEQTLCQVATSFRNNPLAYVADESIQAVKVVAAIAQAVQDSIGSSIRNSDFVIPIPAGMRRLPCGGS